MVEGVKTVAWCAGCMHACWACALLDHLDGRISAWSLPPGQATAAEALQKLAEQILASRSSQRTAAEIAAVRARLQAQEAAAEGLRQEAERVEVRRPFHQQARARTLFSASSRPVEQVRRRLQWRHVHAVCGRDFLHSIVQADRLQAAVGAAHLTETLAEAEAELKLREGEVEESEAAMHACAGEIAGKTKQVDALNRKLEHIIATTPQGEDAGRQHTRVPCRFPRIYGWLQSGDPDAVIFHLLACYLDICTLYCMLHTSVTICQGQTAKRIPAACVNHRPAGSHHPQHEQGAGSSTRGGAPPAGPLGGQAGRVGGPDQEQRCRWRRHHAPARQHRRAAAQARAPRVPVRSMSPSPHINPRVNPG